MTIKKFKEKERVRRANHTGCLGYVREIRFELENSGLSAEARERGAMVGVIWDNGTFSYFAPEGLELVE